MKRLILSIIFCTVAFYGFSQTEATKIRKNEIGVNLFDAAVMQTINLSYEYVGKTNMGFGMDAYCRYKKKDSVGSGVRHGVTPFFRYYFSNRADSRAKGFYGESFLMIYYGTWENGESNVGSGRVLYRTGLNFTIGLGI